MPSFGMDIVTVQAMENSADCASTGWTLGDEADNGYVHDPCTISMAKTSQPNTGGSQFFLDSRRQYAFPPRWSTHSIRKDYFRL